MRQHGGPGALFSLGRRVELTYGKLDAATLGSERGLINYAAGFVNHEDDWSERQRFLEQAAKRITGPDGSMGDEAARELDKMREELSAANGDARRQELRQIFRTVVENQKKRARAVKLLLPDAAQRAQSIRWITTLEQTRRGAAWRHHAIIRDPASFNAFVATLLLQESPDLGADLCECRYCGSFFLVRKRGDSGGRPQRLYCPGTSHRENAHVDAAAKRKRDRYARDRATQPLIDRGYSRRAVENCIKRSFRQHPDSTPDQLAELAGYLSACKPLASVSIKQ